GIRVKVTATRAGYQTQTKVSNPTATVSPGNFTEAPTPTISGEAAVGQTLAAAAGTWVPTPSIGYQWTRNGVNISGANSSTYTLVADDLGQSIAVKVIGTLTGYN